MKRRQPEAALQRAVAAYLDRVLAPPAIWTHIPSGGKRDARTGAQMKAAGLKPGWPDCLIVWSRQYLGTRMLGIELKVGKGRPSKAQLAMADNFAACYAQYAICSTLPEVEEALRICGVPTRGMIGA